jgi:hypothetical protein
MTRPLHSFRSVVAFVALTLSCRVVRANDIYIAQNAAGANNGSACANAYPVGFFNIAGNWGAGSSQIGSGTTVHLCGTISTALTFNGSGASGSPIVLLFEPGAQMSSPVWNWFAISLSNNSHIIIDGGATCGYISGSVVNCNGVIQATDNGSPPLDNQVASIGIDIGSGGNIEIQNLLIQNLYQHTSFSDISQSSPGPIAVRFYGAGGNINVHNNIMHDMAWCLNGGGNNITVAYTEFYNIDHALAMGLTPNSPATWSGILAHDNHVHDLVKWDQSNNGFHHDGFHLFAYCSNGQTFCSGTYVTGINIYNNLCDGDWGQSANACVFFEGNLQNANIYNNIWYDTSIISNYAHGSFANVVGTNINILNNTAIGMGPTVQNGGFMSPAGVNIVIENNVLTSGDELLGLPYTWPTGYGCPNNQCVGSGVSYTLAHNVYANGGDNSWVYSSSSGSSFMPFRTSSFNSWNSDTGETGDLMTSSGGLSSTYRPQSGSPVIGAGANLTSLCATIGSTLCGDMAGAPRPATGPWAAGAYSYSQVMPPSGLTVTVK